MEITKKFRVEMAHRVADAYTQECRGLHGHSYVIDLTIADKGTRGDMVVDFKLVKDIVKPIIDSMDHAIMIDAKDEFLVKIGPLLNPKCLVVPFNPTAENMAQWLFEGISPMFDNFKLERVTVHETESAYAVYSRADYLSDAAKFDKINDVKIVVKNNVEADKDLASMIAEGMEKNPDFYNHMFVRGY